MAHQQQVDFCLSVKQRFPSYFHDRIVVDIGALDVNGSNRHLFDNCLYLGVDIYPGRNVDFVSLGHELGLPDASVDVVISTECFEHDKFYDRTLKNIVRMLKPGGLFLFSCATTGRPEHGTQSATPADAPFIQEFPEWSEYYRNLSESDVRDVIDIDAVFSSFKFVVGEGTCDLYFWGIKKGDLYDRSDYSFVLEKTSQVPEMMPARGAKDRGAATAHSQNEIAALRDRLSDLENHVREISRHIDGNHKSDPCQTLDQYRVRSFMEPGTLMTALRGKASSLKRRLMSPANPGTQQDDRLRHERSCVLESGLFDADWYLSKNPDVALADVEPLDHFLAHGILEGRDPSPLFDTRWYLRRYPDVAAAQVNPLVHYILYGSREGRSPHPLFDASWYEASTHFNRDSHETALASYLRLAGGGARWPFNLLETCSGLFRLESLDDLDEYLEKAKSE